MTRMNEVLSLTGRFWLASCDVFGEVSCYMQNYWQDRSSDSFLEVIHGNTKKDNRI
jgi:hypothetical protein